MTLSPQVPGALHVSINGRAYLVDRDSEQFRGPWTQQVARQQADVGDRAGEQSLAREGLWRRVITSWHHGAGQRVYDATNSDPYRFWKSRGWDPWTEGELRPLPESARFAMRPGHASPYYSSVSGGLVAFINDRVYASDGTGIVNFSAGSPGVTWSVPNKVLSIATDGGTLYVADAGGGGTGGAIYSSAAGFGALAVYVAAGTYYGVWFALGRLWAADATTLANITGSATRTTAVTDPTTNWKWTGVVAGVGGVLAAGWDTSRSSVYLIGLLPDGSGIDGGTVIADMPDGETILAIHSYLGYTILGTNRGVRVCKHQGGGNFVVGPLIDTSTPNASGVATNRPVRAFASFGSFVWFTWESYEYTGTGTDFWCGAGRINLATQLAELQFAYAADVMVKVVKDTSTTTYNVTSIAIEPVSAAYAGGPFAVHFMVEQWGPCTALFNSGGAGASTGNYIDFGKITHGIDDVKVYSQARLRYRTDGTGTPSFKQITDEQGTTVSSPTSTTTSSAVTTDAPWGAIDASEAIQVQIQYDQSGVIDQLSPAWQVFDVRIDAWPSPRRIERWQLPLVIAPQVVREDGQVYQYESLNAEIDALKTLATPSGRVLVDIEVGSRSFVGVVDDVDFRPDRQSGSEWAGTLLVTVSRGLD